MTDLIRDIGQHFSVEDYLVWTRLQGSMWTLADVVIVLYLIRVANLFRIYEGLRRHRLSYIVWGLTLPFSTLLPFAQSGAAIFRIELLVTVPHFLLILYVCLSNIALVSRVYLNILGGKTEDA